MEVSLKVPEGIEVVVVPYLFNMEDTPPLRWDSVTRTWHPPITGSCYIKMPSNRRSVTHRCKYHEKGLRLVRKGV